MEQFITGIHHITAIASGAQKNLAFYAGILGLRLVKKTVNYDAPQVYHLYYGNETGSPGSVMTFFPYEGLKKGRHGKGTLSTTTFSVPMGSIGYWTERFKRFGINYKDPQERFANEVAVYFEDTDGLGLELIFNDQDFRKGYAGGTVEEQHAIRGFYSAEIWEEGYERTASLLMDQLDHTLIYEQGNRFRFAASNTPGNYVDVLCSPGSLKGLSGSGTVHHLAFKTKDKTSQDIIRKRIVLRGLNPTPVLDRTYFSSIYFREPGGVLFEVATESPGFTINETADHLGEELMLPEWFEKDRKKLEESLPVLTFTNTQY